MDRKNIIIIVLLVLVVLLSATGIVIGLRFVDVDEITANKKEETYSLNLEDMYCNVKDSNKIVKVNITIETNDEDSINNLSDKVYLIRDEINQIIRNKTEDELIGKEGQVNLQKDIRETLNKIFDDETIINVYFNDFVMQ